jgi:hypothetical protein
MSSPRRLNGLTTWQQKRQSGQSVLDGSAFDERCDPRVLVLGGWSDAATAATPRIVARPNNLMVNTKTTLTGTGFAARTKLSIAECPTTNWVVTEHPCVSGNKVSVTTDGHGRFIHTFKVELCGGKRGSGPTSQICYIGYPHPQGIDTEHLDGAVKVTVTYP